MEFDQNIQSCDRGVRLEIFPPWPEPAQPQAESDGDSERLSRILQTVRTQPLPGLTITEVPEIFIPTSVTTDHSSFK